MRGCDEVEARSKVAGQASIKTLFVLRRVSLPQVMSFEKIGYRADFWQSDAFSYITLCSVMDDGVS